MNQMPWQQFDPTPGPNLRHEIHSPVTGT
jgi:hypothetical protein